MDPAQNTLAGNENFLTKKPIYQASSVILTQEIGGKTAWKENEIEQHKDRLNDAALAIFKI